MALPKLFLPIKIGHLDIKNRIAMSPMLTKEAVPGFNTINDFHKVHYGARAIGGVGLIIIEGTSISEDGLINKEDLGLWNNDQKNILKELVTLIHQFGSKVGIQLNHAGRKAYHGQIEQLIAPSAIPYSDTFNTPVEMSINAIAKMTQLFIQSAKLASEAGVDVIELHLAHGYLLNQFLSPLANKRTDKYGGTLENRYRFIQEVIYGVKEVFHGSLWIRLSANEYSEDGTTLDEIIQIAKWLKEDGIALIDVSTGGVINVRPSAVYHGYQVPYATAIKKAVNVHVAAVGLLNDANLTNFLLETEQADIINLGRPLLSNPNWLLNAARILDVEKELTVFNSTYERGKRI